MLRRYLVGICAFGVWSLCAAAPGESSLNQEIDETLTAKCLDPGQTAISIVGAPGSKLIYARNVNTPLLPASVLKLVTTAAALHYLGPEYRFKTDIRYSGQRRDEVIEGNLIIRAGGDPKLLGGAVRDIAEQVYLHGVRRVTGNLVIDSSFFDALDRAPHWDEKRSQRPYDAKLGALSINYNTVQVHVRPAEHIGEQVQAWLEPAPAYMQLINVAQTTRSSKNTVWAKRGMKQGRSVVEVDGELPLQATERTIVINVDNPLRFAAETFRTYLEQIGITIAGGTVFHGANSVRGELLYQHTSPPLSVILKELNTYSNNFIAEQIVKTMAAEKMGRPGTHANGTRLLTTFLKQLGVDTRGLRVVDGSGLSRDNRMTAQAMSQLLVAILPHFEIAPDFMAAIRVMGADGIRSNRFKNSPVKARVRAKTGSLWGVSNLVGYVPGANGGLYAYALFLNNNSCGYRWADVLEDRIITAIHEFDKGKSGDVPLVSSMWQPATPPRHAGRLNEVTVR